MFKVSSMLHGTGGCAGLSSKVQSGQIAQGQTAEADMGKAIRAAVVAATLGAVTAATISMAAPVGAEGSTVTRGDFHTFAVGIARGYNITGHAEMVRRANGT